MKECCMTCRNRLDGIKSDFGKLGTDELIDTPMDGFICLGLDFEGVAFWMVNHDETKGICEMYTARKESGNDKGTEGKGVEDSECL